MAAYIAYNDGTNTVYGKLNDDGNKYELIDDSNNDEINDAKADDSLLSYNNFDRKDGLSVEAMNFIADREAMNPSTPGSGSGTAPAAPASGSGTTSGNNEDDEHMDWSTLIKSLGEKKWASINPETGEAERLNEVDMPNYLLKKEDRDTEKTAKFESVVGKCGLVEGSRLYKLRDQLIKQLRDLAEKQGKDENCIGVCQEDEDLLTMIEKMRKLMGEDAKNCQLETFDKNERLKLLAAKRAMLDRADFSFLHSECESDINCNPFKENVIPVSLRKCSGVYEGEILFNSPQMAAIGKALAGKQRNGESPAALGHASNLYPTGVIAPGTDPNQLWVNVCYLVSIPFSSLSKDARAKLKAMREADKAARKAGEPLPDQELQEVTYLDTKWVPANVMEQEKFVTMQKLDKAITEQKRTILKVNRRIIQLQLQMLNVQGNDEWFSHEDNSYGYSSELAIHEKVKHSVERARYEIQRRAAARAQRDADEMYGLKLKRNGLGNKKNASLRRLMDM